jgi:dTDP-glucose pyrophosphorylase
VKALVLAAGNGKRLSAVTQGHNKCMLSLNGKPLLQYNLENAVQAGVTEIILVVGYQEDEIRARFGNAFRGIPITYVNQPAPKGLVDAMDCGRNALAGSDFLLFLGDEVLQNPRHIEMIAAFDDANLMGFCGVVYEPDKREIRKTYSVIQDQHNRIYRLIEKPTDPPNHLRGTGNCLFRYSIFDYLGAVPINPLRGEKELPDLIQRAIDDKQQVFSFRIADGYLNINFPEDVQQAEAIFQAKVSVSSSSVGWEL